MTTPAAPTTTASPGTVVAAGTTVTLIGSPAGGTWAQSSGEGVTLTAVASSSDTRRSFIATNNNINSGMNRSFRYTLNGASSVIFITANPLVLNVRATHDQVDTLSSVTLAGTTTGTATYAWTKLSGPQGSLSSATAATPTYAPAQPGQHVLGLVTTSAGVAAPTVYFRVNALTGHGLTSRHKGLSIVTRRYTRRLGVNEQSILIPPALSAPVSVTATKNSDSATILWQPPAFTNGETITGYRVTRDGQDAGGYGIFTTVVAATARSFTFLSLTGSSYTLTVQAVTYAGDGPSTSVPVGLISGYGDSYGNNYGGTL